MFAWWGICTCVNNNKRSQSSPAAKFLLLPQPCPLYFSMPTVFGSPALITSRIVPPNIILQQASKRERGRDWDPPFSPWVGSRWVLSLGGNSIRWESAELQESLALGTLPAPLKGSLSTDSFLFPFSGWITVIFNAGGDRWMFLTACVSFVLGYIKCQTREERCGGDAGQVVKALTVGLFCVEQVVLKQNYRLCPGIPFSYTILNPRKALQPFCHFICWSRTPAPVLLQSAPRNSWKWFHICLLFFPFHILAARVRGRKAEEEIPGQWWQGERSQPRNGKLSNSLWESEIKQASLSGYSPSSMLPQPRVP